MKLPKKKTNAGYIDTYIAQTCMQRVALLSSYAFVAEKLSPTKFLKLEFDKIAHQNIRFSWNVLISGVNN